jgi:RNA polymerase sigma-70 factor (ECF subfamily)
LQNEPGILDDEPSHPDVPVVPGRPEERELIARLLAGDEATFVALLDDHNDTMVRVARGFVSSRSVAEEVVQETWMAILKALPRFQGRSSLKTWMFRILTNRAKTRARREGRTVPMSAMGALDEEGQPAVDPDRFDANGMWRSPPERWGTPEKEVGDKELQQQIDAAIETLPERQRTVLTLRDVKGWTSAEVCNVLEISDTNQRVLLHRARNKVRAALADYLEGRR